jgi:hypothetical protein
VPKLGRNPYPRRYGGGPSTLELEHQALLDALAPGWDVSEGTAIYAECWAHALAITAIWQLNGRLRGHLVPARMLETLPVWEEACGLRPAPSDSPPVRRRAVAAQLRGFVGNTLRDISDVCAAAAGTAYEGLVIVDAAQATVYWPGINPGPPGFEWSSNRATVGVKIAKSGAADSDFLALVQRINRQLAVLCPAWMTFQVGVEEGGAICDVAICDQTFLGGT